jgi:hypothetical protein
MVRRHLEAIRRASPETIPTYVALGTAQLPLARALDDARAGDLERLASLFDSYRAPARRRRRDET